MNYVNSMKLKIARTSAKKIKWKKIEWISGGTRRYLCLNVHSSDKCTMVLE